MFAGVLQVSREQIVQRLRGSRFEVAATTDNLRPEWRLLALVEAVGGARWANLVLSVEKRHRSGQYDVAKPRWDHVRVKYISRSSTVLPGISAAFHPRYLFLKRKNQTVL